MKLQIFTFPFCPYCNSKDTTSVIYLYRYNDNNTFIKKNDNEVKYSERKRKPKRLNYDGTLITDHNHNKYCNKCHKSFNSIENLYAVDISKITLVFMLSKARYKYEFVFDDKPIFIFKKNYELVSQEIITNKDKIKILDSITNSKINFWNKEYINKDYDNYKWILTEVVDPNLTEKEIKNIINKKLAYIIVELEHNPISYIKYDKKTGKPL